ncbi:unnamed protein product, partial [Porites lobata]
VFQFPKAQHLQTKVMPQCVDLATNLVVLPVLSLLVNLAVWSLNIDDGCTCSIQKCYVSSQSLIDTLTGGGLNNTLAKIIRTDLVSLSIAYHLYLKISLLVQGLVLA